jgi:fibronectin-binding autotransporter adhesin
MKSTRYDYLLILPLLAWPVLAQTSITTDTKRFDADTANGSWILNEGVNRGVSTKSDEVIRLAKTGTAGSYTLTINGSVIQSATGGNVGKAIRTSNDITNPADLTYTITIGTTGLVQSVGDDAIQVRQGSVFNLTNSGVVYSGSNLAGSPAGPLDLGQALDLTSAIGGTVVNEATGLLRSDGHDAVRLGSNMTFTNYGTILGNSVVNDSSTNNVFNTAPASTDVTSPYSTSEGVSFEEGANSSLDNYGSISGSRHGVESAEQATNVTITNRETGTIIGRNGSGVGFDSTSTSATNVIVNNYGLIRGDYAGVGNIIDRTGSASPTNDGDGDGVDIDGAATINNYSTGQIISTGAGGYDSGGRANNSEGISIGGGVIINDGLIQGADRGIVVNNDGNTDRSGVAATTITNNEGATIEGQNGFAIRLENKLGDARDNDTITNSGTIIGTGSIPDPEVMVTLQDGSVDTHSVGTLDGIVYAGEGLARFTRGDGAAIQMGEGDDVLTNTGTITGNTGRAINMEGGNDIVNYTGGTITGSINGGAGNDTLNLGSGVVTASAIQNFETVGVASGSASLSGVISGTTLSKTGEGRLVLANANLYTGLTTVAEGTLSVENESGSATGLGDVQVDVGAMLTGGGFIAGNVVLDGVLAPGNSIGSLTVDGDVTWNGTTGNAWNFELGLEDTSDRLLVGGDFLKGTGVDYVFDFQSGANLGTYILVDWTGDTTFAAEDFSFVNLGNGFTGQFTINGSQLEFTTSAVPEPATYAALFGAGALGFALWRRRVGRAV